MKILFSIALTHIFRTLPGRFGSEKWKNKAFLEKTHFLKSQKKNVEPKRNTTAGFLNRKSADDLKNGMKQAQTDSTHPLNPKQRVRKG